MNTNDADRTTQADQHFLTIWICHESLVLIAYSKTCVKRPLSKRPKIGFQDQLLLNPGQKYCRMIQGDHSAIHSAFIKLPFVIKIFALSIFEWSFYTVFLYSQKTLFNTHADVSRGA